MALPTITLIGLIQKKETRQTQSGKAITALNISCGEKNSKGEFDNLYIKANFCGKRSGFVDQYFNEGDVIQVTGKLITTNYTKQDGSKVYETKFKFPEASFIPRPRNSNGGQAQEDRGYSNPNPQYQQQQPSQQPPVIEIEDESIPF